MVNIAKLVSTVKKGLSSKEAKEFLEMMKKKMPEGKTLKRQDTPDGKFLQRRKELRDKKIKESASKFVKRRKQLAGAKGAAGKMAQRTGPSKKEVIGYGTAAGTGLLASSQIKKRRKKGEK